MPAIPAIIRSAGRIAGAILATAFANLPEAYYESYCRAIKAGAYGG